MGRRFSRLVPTLALVAELLPSLPVFRFRSGRCRGAPPRAPTRIGVVGPSRGSACLGDATRGLSLRLALPARFAAALSYLVAVVASVHGIYADDDPTVLGIAFIVNTFLLRSRSSGCARPRASALSPVRSRLILRLKPCRPHPHRRLTLASWVPQTRRAIETANGTRSGSCRRSISTCRSAWTTTRPSGTAHPSSVRSSTTAST